MMNHLLLVALYFLEYLYPHFHYHQSRHIYKELANNLRLAFSGVYILFIWLYGIVPLSTFFAY